MSRRSYLVLPACLLIALAILAPILPHFGTSLIYPANSQYSDLTITHWPAFAYTRDQLQTTGKVPLWRTSILSGTPFAADPLAGLFYPLHWIAFIPQVPLSIAFNLLMLIHFTLAAATMYLLMRRWEIGRAAAFLAALAYAASPKIVAHMGVGHVTLVEAWAWVPLVIAGAVPSPRTGKFNALMSGLALALCLAADARMAVYALILLGLYVVITRAQRSRRTWLALIGLLVVIGVVAFAVSAAAWLPALTLTDGTARARLSPQEAGALSLDAVYLLGTLIADRSGAAERTTYVGLVVLLLALTGLKLMWRSRRRLMIWFVFTIGIGIIAALGTNTPLYNLVYHLPGSTLFRVPARAWFMVSFALAALAGFGVQGLLEWRGQPQRRSGTLATTIILFAVLFGLAGALRTRSPSFLAIAVFVPLTVILIIFRVRGRLAADRFLLAVALLLVIDLLPLDWVLYRPVGLAEAFADGQEPAVWLTQQPGLFRAYSPSYSIPQQVAQQFQLQLADGIDPLQLQRYVAFMYQASGVGPWSYAVTLPDFVGAQKDEDIRTALKDIKPNAALLGLLNVKYVDAAFPIAEPDLIERVVFSTTHVYENARVLPRVFLVNKIDVADSPEAAGA
ncbi:MAG TPA: YfhO family protein, partial [Anaerolineae bacterium]|nr:YfhO family protein [Anaerolineae bacterium]